MLTIKIQKSEYFDTKKQKFVETPEVVYVLEHSLLSVSKWEKKWGKPFISKVPKTDEETFDYIKCMLQTPVANPENISRMPNQALLEIQKYITDPMSATFFNEIKTPGGGRSETITAELIYYMMFSFGIPKECETWHLNTLLTQIKVCAKKNAPTKKKASREEIQERNRRLNKERREKLNSKG